MAFDFKKRIQEIIRGEEQTGDFVTVPTANYVGLRGKGDPNEEGGAYYEAIDV